MLVVKLRDRPPVKRRSSFIVKEEPRDVFLFSPCLTNTKPAQKDSRSPTLPTAPTARKRARSKLEKKIKKDVVEDKPMEEQVTAYVTTRIHRRIDDQYIVSWWKYNPSQCTLQSTESLESSPLLLKQFDEYEKGIRAIIKCLEKENRYLDEYRRKHVNLLDQIISDEDWDRWVVQYPSRYHKKIQEHKIGYWTIKAVELEWMKILDPNADHYEHPLYLESFDAKAPPPKFQFIKNYIQSELVERCLNSQLIKKHQCVFGPRESFCQDCRQRNQVQRIDQTRVQLPDVLSNMYLVVCGSRTCGCHSEGPCNNFLPVGARGAPMVVFYERRYEGYGVRAITSIPKGTIMSEYVGRLFTSQEEYVRDESYILETETGFMVDTKMFGNEARFFGSSCSPSLEWVKVFVRGTDMQDQYRTVFVTNRDLKPGEELSIDYHSGMNKSDRPKVCARCRCGSKNCRGWV